MCVVSNWLTVITKNDFFFYNSDFYNRIEWNNNWVPALPGSMQLALKTGPLCPILYIKLWKPCFHMAPIRNFLMPSGSKKKEPRYKYLKFLLTEFHLTGALRRILTGVPSSGALLKP